MLRLNDTLPKALHTLTVPVVTATTNPDPRYNKFELNLRNAAGENLEVALAVDGEPVLYGIRVSVWPLRWKVRPKMDTPKGWGGKVRVSVPIEVIDDVEVKVYGILLTLPQDPNIEFFPPSSVTVSSASYGETLRVTDKRFDGTNNALLISFTPDSFSIGLFTVSFDVAYPETVPSFNLWRVALCDVGMVQAPRKYTEMTTACNNNSAVNLSVGLGGTGSMGMVSNIRYCQKHCDSYQDCMAFDSDGAFCFLKATCPGVEGRGGIGYKVIDGSDGKIDDPMVPCSLNGIDRSQRGSAFITVFAVPGFDMYEAVAMKAPIVAAARLSSGPSCFALLVSIVAFGALQRPSYVLE